MAQQYGGFTKIKIMVLNHMILNNPWLAIIQLFGIYVIMGHHPRPQSHPAHHIGFLGSKWFYFSFSDDVDIFLWPQCSQRLLISPGKTMQFTGRVSLTTGTQNQWFAGPLLLWSIPQQKIMLILHCQTPAISCVCFGSLGLYYVDPFQVFDPTCETKKRWFKCRSIGCLICFGIYHVSKCGWVIEGNGLVWSGLVVICFNRWNTFTGAHVQAHEYNIDHSLTCTHP